MFNDPCAVAFDGRAVGPDIHEVLNRIARAIHRIVLQELAELIQQHNRDGLREFSDAKRADARKRHQKRFAENVPAKQPLDCAEYNVVSDDKVARQKDRKLNVPRNVKHKPQHEPDHKQPRRDREPQDHPFAFAFLAAAMIMPAAAFVVIVMIVPAAACVMVVMLVMMRMFLMLRAAASASFLFVLMFVFVFMIVMTHKTLLAPLIHASAQARYR